MSVFIYALVDPRDDEPRYVGRSVAPRRRFSAHVSVGMIRMENRRRYDWIRALEAIGLRPRLVILEKCRLRQAPEAEQRWIDTYRPRGKLFNGAALRLTRLKPLSRFGKVRKYR